MFYLRLVLRNVFRARLRAGLTILGLVIAILAFGLLQTVVRAWYAGTDMSSAARLFTRNSISLTFSMPLYYRERIAAVPGVKSVGISNWFGGIWREPQNFFAQFATDIPLLAKQYPEFRFDPTQYADLMRDRQGAAIGRELADLYGFRLGDRVTLKGTIYPGNWEFNVRAIYEGRDATAITRQMYFHYDYLNEALRQTAPARANQVGVFVVEIADPTAGAEVAKAIDDGFRSSLAETLTESEKAFQLGFIAMVEAIVIAIRAVSYVVILIIMAVAANTMAMTARERIAEYATLKALGFGPGTVAALVMAEALLLALIGAGIAMALLGPVAAGFHAATVRVFAKFPVVAATYWMQAGCGLAVGLVAGALPAWHSARVRIVDGLRRIG